jgi:hypothetical protein
MCGAGQSSIVCPRNETFHFREPQQAKTLPRVTHRAFDVSCFDVAQQKNVQRAVCYACWTFDVLITTIMDCGFWAECCNMM